MADHSDDHGHSPAAWTGTIIMLVGAVLCCWGVYFGPMLLLYVGLGVFLAGALAWFVMDRAAEGRDEPAHRGTPITPAAATRGGQDA